MMGLVLSFVGFAVLFVAIWLLHKPLDVHSCSQKSARAAHRVLEWILTAWAVVLVAQVACLFRQNGDTEMNDTVYQFTVKDRTGGEVSLKDYAGKVLLIVNTATRCGFTPQYDGLEAMYERLKGRGFDLLDFPCNQFGQQAPGTDEEIHGFCVLNYKTAFPQFAKVEVNGENAAPLFRYLVANTTFEGFPQDGKLAPILEKMLGEADPDYAKKSDIKWNFTKFLVGKDGRIVRRFEPTAPLAEVESAIEAELSK